MKALRNILIGGIALGNTVLGGNVFSQDRAPDYVQGKILNKYYAFDESDLTKEDSVYTAKYFDFLMNSEVNNLDVVCFEGYASSPGTDEYNDSLSNVRARKLADYFEYLYPDVKTEISFFGEVPRKGEFNDSINNLDQAVKVIPRSNNFGDALEALKANPSFNNKKIKQILLLDKSWSMGRNGAWDFLQRYDFSGFDEVHAFPGDNRESDIMKVENIKNLEARGATCYFSASDKLLSDFENGDLLTIVNGRDNVGGPTPNELVSKALENNVSLSYLYLSPTTKDNFGKTLREMSHKTKGSFTCVETCE